MKKIIPSLLLAAAVFTVYAPALWNGFVWDDTALILRDPLIRSWRLIPEGFQHFLFIDATASNFYRPIQRLTYILEYAVFGFQPMGFHITSIACHALAAIALFFFSRELLRQLGGSEGRVRFISLAAALAWAFHPVHTSAVAYISGRADSLAAVFGFAALYCGLRSLREAGSSVWLFNAVAGLALLLSLLSKEMGAIFLVAWLVVLVLGKHWKAVIRASIVALFVLASYLSLRFGAEHHPPPQVSAPLPALVRPILAARAIAEYAGLILLPINLQMDRDVETHPTGFGNESMSGAARRELQTLVGLILIAGLIYWLLRERKRDRAVFICLVLTLVTYVPVSGIVRLNATVAEHWLYMPLAFLLLAAGLALIRFAPREGNGNRITRRILLSAAALWFVFLAGRTFVRMQDWKDQRTFLEGAVAKRGASSRMLINLGGLELAEGRFDLAKKHLDAALQIEPQQPFAVINRAAVALKQDDFAAARDLLMRATQLPPVDAQAHELLAVLEHKETGRANLQRLRLASRTGGPNWSIEKRYVRLLDETGATEAAINELQHCLATQWYRAESWQLLSELLWKAGRQKEAAEALQRAHRYDVRLSERAPKIL